MRSSVYFIVSVLFLTSVSLILVDESENINQTEQILTFKSDGNDREGDLGSDDYNCPIENDTRCWHAMRITNLTTDWLELFRTTGDNWPFSAPTAEESLNNFDVEILRGWGDISATDYAISRGSDIDYNDIAIRWNGGVRAEFNHMLQYYFATNDVPNMSSFEIEKAIILASVEYSESHSHLSLGADDDSNCRGVDNDCDPEPDDDDDYGGGGHSHSHSHGSFTHTHSHTHSGYCDGPQIVEELKNRCEFLTLTSDLREVIREANETTILVDFENELDSIFEDVKFENSSTITQDAVLRMHSAYHATNNSYEMLRGVKVALTASIASEIEWDGSTYGADNVSWPCRNCKSPFVPLMATLYSDYSNTKDAVFITDTLTCSELNWRECATINSLKVDYDGDCIISTGEEQICMESYYLELDTTKRPLNLQKTFADISDLDSSISSESSARYGPQLNIMQNGVSIPIEYPMGIDPQPPQPWTCEDAIAAYSAAFSGATVTSCAEPPSSGSGPIVTVMFADKFIWDIEFTFFDDVGGEIQNTTSNASQLLEENILRVVPIYQDLSVDEMPQIFATMVDPSRATSGDPLWDPIPILTSKIVVNTDVYTNCFDWAIDTFGKSVDQRFAGITCNGVAFGDLFMAGDSVSNYSGETMGRGQTYVVCVCDLGVETGPNAGATVTHYCVNPPTSDCESCCGPTCEVKERLDDFIIQANGGSTGVLTFEYHEDLAEMQTNNPNSPFYIEAQDSMNKDGVVEEPQEDTEDDKGLPGFSVVLSLVSIILVAVIKGRRLH